VERGGALLKALYENRYSSRAMQPPVSVLKKLRPHTYAAVPGSVVTCSRGGEFELGLLATAEACGFRTDDHPGHMSAINNSRGATYVRKASISSLLGSRPPSSSRRIFGMSQRIIVRLGSSCASH